MGLICVITCQVGYKLSWLCDRCDRVVYHHHHRRTMWFWNRLESVSRKVQEKLQVFNHFTFTKENLSITRKRWKTVPSATKSTLSLENYALVQWYIYCMNRKWVWLQKLMCVSFRLMVRERFFFCLMKFNEWMWNFICIIFFPIKPEHRLNQVLCVYTE